MRATPLPITHPHLIQEWHPNKNNVTMEQVFKGSVCLVWWQGECGHEWEASPASRSRVKASGCPYCSGRKAIPGVNDFTVEHPLIALQWHPTKNIGLDPTTIKSGSQKSAWWLGDCGHEWEALIRNRVRGAGCHICRGKAVVAGINDLQTTSPLLATFWDYEKMVPYYQRTLQISQIN